MNQSKPRRQRGVLLTPTGWKKLQEAIGEAETWENSGTRYSLEALSTRTGIEPTTIRKVLEREKGVDKQTLKRFFQGFDLELEQCDFFRPHEEYEPLESLTINNTCQDWGEAIDVSTFYGRTQELATLEQWIIQDCCRVVAILGTGGIGKTALAVKLAQQIQDSFEFVFWRSLLQAPPLDELLTKLIQFLSNGQELALPATTDEKITRLLDYLRSHRCLIVLDNLETLLCSGEGTFHSRAGYYRNKYEDYGRLLKRLGETSHQSCLVLTARALLGGKSRVKNKLNKMFRHLRWHSQSASEAGSLDLGVESQGEIQEVGTSEELPCSLYLRDEKLLIEIGYAPGNVINLLRQLNTDLSGYDFSCLTIWQAYLEGVNLYHVNFAYSNLAKSVFTET